MDTGMEKIDTKSLEQLVVPKTYGGPKGHERVKVRGRGTKEARWTKASSLAYAPTNQSLSFLFV
jgi:hypothetical protein